MTSCNLVISCLLCTNGTHRAQFYPTGKAERTSSLLLRCGNRRLTWHLLVERVGTGTQLLKCWTAFSMRHAHADTCGISWSQPFPYFLGICTENAQAAYSISLQWNSIGKLQSLFQVCCWSWAWEQKPGWGWETCSTAIPVLLLLLYWCTFLLGMFVPE